MKPDHATWNVTWTVLIQIQLNCVFFCRLYFDFVLSPAFKYKALEGVLSSFIRVLYQGRTFPAATEQKRYRLVLLWARFERALQSFSFFLCFLSWRMQTLQRFLRTWTPLMKLRARLETSGDWTQIYHQTALLFITRFLYWTFLYLLYSLSLIGIFSVICLF